MKDCSLLRWCDGPWHCLLDSGENGNAHFRKALLAKRPEAVVNSWTYRPLRGQCGFQHLKRPLTPAKCPHLADTLIFFEELATAAKYRGASANLGNFP